MALLEVKNLHTYFKTRKGIVKAVNRFHRKKAEAPKAPSAPSSEEKLLMEIRDLLKERS